MAAGLLVSVSLADGAAFAGPLVAALDNPRPVRDPASLGAEFVLHFAPAPVAKQERLPPPQAVSLPATVGTYQASDWYVMYTKGNECFPPEGSLVSITSLSEKRAIGLLQWPLRYVAEPDRCKDRMLPSVQTGKCIDGSDPKVRVCSNGVMIMLDLTEAVDAKGQAIEFGAVAEAIRRALSMSNRR